MSRSDKYPKLVVDLDKLRRNIDRIRIQCEDKGVEIAGVIKGCTGLTECARQFAREGCRFIASSGWSNWRHSAAAGYKRS